MTPQRTEQLGLPIAEPDADQAGDLDVVLLERLVAACKAVARELTYDVCATSLDAIWSNRGRPVTGAVLRAAMSDARGNYFRVEWAFWFARYSDAVVEVLLEVAGRARPKKKPEDELRDLKAAIREELPKRAAALIRKAELP